MTSRNTNSSIAAQLAKAFIAAGMLAGLAVGNAAPNAIRPAGGGYSWQEPHAKVLPAGALEWSPHPFIFEKGDSVRYIDFETGDDAKDGTTRLTAWKHHPWDVRATAKARASTGIQTYVFKGGSVYRGELKARESGTLDNPIRLTCDPSWGKGAARFYGSTQIKGGWKRGNSLEAPGIPQPENVWFIDLGKAYDPDPDRAKFSSMWQVDGERVDRLHIAREPNYDHSDPNNPVKGWPVWSAYNMKSGTFTSPFLKNLGDKSLLDRAAIWTEGGFLMASACRVPVSPGSYNPDAGSVVLPTKADRKEYKNIPRAEVHFMIENVAQFLDAAGEYFFDASGPKAGRLYLYPAGGADPNRVVYEVAQTRFPILISDQHDIVISGMEFRYNDSNKGTRDWPFESSACVRIAGSCSRITVKNCNFYYVADAIGAYPKVFYIDKGSSADVIDDIILSDNDIQHVEMGGAILLCGDNEQAKGSTFAQLKHVEVMRNRLLDTGFRHGRLTWASIPAIRVEYPETCEIAGNIVDTSFGNGIITYGGKASDSFNTAPLTRILVHHNQLDNTLLGCNDYGGLEHFQGGPIYIYNNITRNSIGNKTLGGELGYNLYLDGAFKCYVFNNIIAGNVKAAEPGYYNNCGYFMVFGFMDQLFNNTIYHFNNALDGSSGNRSNILGNLMVDCKLSFIGQNRPGDVSMLGGGDTGAMGRSGIPTMAYASNVFFGSPKTFGVIGGTSKEGAGRGAPILTGNTLDDLRKKLEAENCRLASIGWQVAELPLVNPAHKDYRPTANSGVKDRGVKYFVPWALARNVGEWNFYKSLSHPEVVLGEGFYMTDEYVHRGMYYFIPRNDLIVSSCSADDYVTGPLEDWIDGALVFDGKSRVATLSHAEMTKNMAYPGDEAIAGTTYDGSKRETLDMEANSFLIEIVFKTSAGHTDGVLVSKSAQSGYELAVGPNGGPRLTIQSVSAKASVTSAVKVNDGRWHHVIVEVDRALGQATIYVDGKSVGAGKLDAIGKDETLANAADFVVGRGLAGAVDFLRVCRSTLAESKTTIEELYAWEFNGPFLRDFTGKAPANGKRDAGAIGR